MKKRKEKLARIQVLMSQQDKLKLKKDALKKGKTMSSLLYQAYKEVYVAE